MSTSILAPARLASIAPESGATMTVARTSSPEFPGGDTRPDGAGSLSAPVSWVPGPEENAGTSNVVWRPVASHRPAC